MTDPTARRGAEGGPPQLAAHLPSHHPGWAYGLLAIVLLALAFGAWGVWKTLAPGSAGDAAAGGELERLAQEVATLKRSDQISRDANRDLQATLAERDEEIAGLRADVAFYERFVGSTAQRRGLTVHDLELRPQADANVWHFVATLTQTLDRDTPSIGRLTLSVEGTREGKLQRLAWQDLRQQPSAAGTEYSFKYFQRVEGDVMLPAGFVPLRVYTRLTPEGGTPVERTFPWAETTRMPTSG